MSRVAADRPTALVAGAGLAGLAAALRLREHGFDVTVLEREAAPGGRVRGLAFGGVEIDPCATLCAGADLALLQILGAIGQADELEVWNEGSLLRADAGGGREPLGFARPGPGRRSSGISLREAMRSVRLDRLAARYAAHLDRREPERGTVLDDRSIAEWTRLYFGEGVRESWVAPLSGAATLGDTGETSRLLFLRLYAQLRRSGPASLRAGPGALAEALSRRVATRLGVTLERVTQAPAGRFEAEARVVHGSRPGQTLRFAADALVVALPPAAALESVAEVLGSAERDYLRGVRFHPGVAVAFQTRDAVLAPARRIVPTTAGALAALQFQGATPGRSDLVVALGSGAFAAESAGDADDVIVRRLEAEAERVAPRHLRDVRELRVVRWPAALPRFEVGHYRAIARLRKVEAAARAAGRRLAFAGDHLVGPRVEDAIASGLRAADALAAG